MFQISAKISFKIKYEGFWNRPCAKHNEEQRESQQAADMEIPTETCTHDIKKFIALFLSFQGFFLDVSAAKPISVFSLWSFRFDVFLLLEELLFTTVQLISFDISPHCSTLLYSL